MNKPAIDKTAAWLGIMAWFIHNIWLKMAILSKNIDEQRNKYDIKRRHRVCDLVEKFLELFKIAK